MKCVMCNGKTVQKTVEHTEFGIPLGKFPATVCTRCGETYFSAETVDAIQRKSKERGLFGLARKVKVGEVGSSIAIRIPKELAEFMELEKGREVVLMPKNKHDLHIQV